MPDHETHPAACQFKEIRANSFRNPRAPRRNQSTSISLQRQFGKDPYWRMASVAPTAGYRRLPSPPALTRKVCSGPYCSGSDRVHVPPRRAVIAGMRCSAVSARSPAAISVLESTKGVAPNAGTIWPPRPDPGSWLSPASVDALAGRSHSACGHRASP